jgi:CHAD domain-containing protein
MPYTTLQFELSENLKIKKLLSKLGNSTSLEIVAQHYSIKRYYDSFDWRLYQAGILCEFNQSKASSQLRLIALNSGQQIVSADMDEVPAFVDQFGVTEIANLLSPILQMRALISLTAQPFQAYHINILNKDQKTTARLLIEEYEALPHRLTIIPLRGYAKASNQLKNVLEQKLELKLAKKSVLHAALKLQGRKVLDYSSKLNIQLDPAMRSDIACKYIYSHLLNSIKDNEAGTISDIDSEFLHDFRVAVRRTRSGLSQLKDVLPTNSTSEFADFFAWLGQITSQARDMDVYLLNFPDYRQSLPDNMQTNLAPLYSLLQKKQRKAQQELATKLRSTAYISKLQQWDQFLKEPGKKKPTEANAVIDILQLANKRIWKVYQRVMQEGNAINVQSPPETLHELRKSCKKLRYLMEFFQSLYPENKMKRLVKALKNFQDILGNFQDYEVQENNLIKFGEELMALQTPAETFLAMGVLVQNLRTRRIQARKDFAGRFDDFKHEQKLFKSLFAGK